jgi:NADH dehydrogenase (ubiquinone) Fe-S protein 1
MMRTGILRGLKPVTGRIASSTTRRTFASTPRAAAEVEITIDGKKVKIEQGAALIQACEKAGATIPRYCYHVRCRCNLLQCPAF